MVRITMDEQRIYGIEEDKSSWPVYRASFKPDDRKAHWFVTEAAAVGDVLVQVVGVYFPLILRHISGQAYHFLGHAEPFTDHRSNYRVTEPLSLGCLNYDKLAVAAIELLQTLCKPPASQTKAGWVHNSEVIEIY